jgi:hypothetical protein
MKLSIVGCISIAALVPGCLGHDGTATARADTDGISGRWLVARVLVKGGSTTDASWVKPGESLTISEAQVRLRGVTCDRAAGTDVREVVQLESVLAECRSDRARARGCVNAWDIVRDFELCGWKPPSQVHEVAISCSDPMTEVPVFYRTADRRLIGRRDDVTVCAEAATRAEPR